MGAVYKAQDMRLLRHVALKLLRPELMIDKKKRLRFIKEAQTASSLNHPNICTIHDINEDSSQHFIVMELVRKQQSKRNSGRETQTTRSELEKSQSKFVKRFLQFIRRESHIVISSLKIL